MRRVAGVFPLNATALPFFVAAGVTALCAVALNFADRGTSSNIPTSSRALNDDAASRNAALPSEPMQISNAAKKAAREKGRVLARLTPEVEAPKLPEAGPSELPPPETGRASWYALGTPTASGEAMDADALTAAHRSLPLGMHVRVENLENGRAVVVRINDRGPFAKDRIIDLSKAAAAELGMIADGVAKVRVIPVALEETAALPASARPTSLAKR
jgi:rare lipoprotein A